MNVSVELGERSYDVVLADGARHHLAALIARRAPRAQVAVIVTTPSIAQQAWFDVTSGIEQHVLTVPDGEAAKSLDVLEVLLEEVAPVSYTHLSSDRCSRRIRPRHWRGCAANVNSGTAKSREPGSTRRRHSTTSSHRSRVKSIG